MRRCFALMAAAGILWAAWTGEANAFKRNCKSDCNEECESCESDKYCQVTLGGRSLDPNVSNPSKYECLKKALKCNANEGLDGDKCVPCKDDEEVKNGKCAKSRDSLLGVKKERNELLKGSTASTLNKVAAVGGAVTGTTSAITSGIGAFATDFGSMKSKIDTCLSSLNITQN